MRVELGGKIQVNNSIPFSFPPASSRSRPHRSRPRSGPPGARPWCGTSQRCRPQSYSGFFLPPFRVPEDPLVVEIRPNVAVDGLVVASEGEHSVLSQDPLQSSVGGLVVELLISDVADAVAGVHGVLDGEAAVDREALGLWKALVAAGIHLRPVDLRVEAGRRRVDGGRLGVQAFPRGGGGVQGEHWGECEEITYS